MIRLLVWGISATALQGVAQPRQAVNLAQQLCCTFGVLPHLGVQVVAVKALGIQVLCGGLLQPGQAGTEHEHEHMLGVG